MVLNDGIWWKHRQPRSTVNTVQLTLLHIVQKRTAHFTEGLLVPCHPPAPTLIVASGHPVLHTDCLILAHTDCLKRASTDCLMSLSGILSTCSSIPNTTTAAAADSTNADELWAQ